MRGNKYLINEAQYKQPVAEYKRGFRKFFCCSATATRAPEPVGTGPEAVKIKLNQACRGREGRLV